MREPLAYLLTWTCYGTWLHGDDRGSVDRTHCMPGEAYLPANAGRVQFEVRAMDGQAMRLGVRERSVVHSAINRTRVFSKLDVARAERPDQSRTCGCRKRGCATRAHDGLLQIACNTSVANRGYDGAGRTRVDASWEHAVFVECEERQRGDRVRLMKGRMFRGDRRVIDACQRQWRNQCRERERTVTHKPGRVTRDCKKPLPSGRGSDAARMARAGANAGGAA